MPRARLKKEQKKKKKKPDNFPNVVHIQVCLAIGNRYIVTEELRNKASRAEKERKQNGR